MAVSRGPRLLVCQSVGTSPGRARSPVFDGSRSSAGPRPWQDPESRGYWCVGRYIRSVRLYDLPCSGETRVRRESGVHNVTHRPLVSWSMSLVIGQGWYGLIRLGMNGYCGIRFGSVGYDWVRLGTLRVSYLQWQCGLCLSWCRLSSTQTGEPNAGCQLPPRVNHGGTHRSTLNAAEPGQPAS